MGGENLLPSSSQSAEAGFLHSREEETPFIHFIHICLYEKINMQEKEKYISLNPSHLVW